MNGFRRLTAGLAFGAVLLLGATAGAQESSPNSAGTPTSAMGSPGTAQGTGVAPDLDYDGKLRDDALGVDDRRPDEGETRKRIRAEVEKLETRLDAFRVDVQVAADRVDPKDTDVEHLPLDTFDQHRDELDDHLDDIARDIVNLPGKPNAKLVDRMEKKVKTIHKQLETLKKNRNGKHVLAILGLVLKEIDDLDESADGIEV